MECFIALQLLVQVCLAISI